MPNVSLVIAEVRARCMDSLVSWRRPANELVVLTAGGVCKNLCG